MNAENTLMIETDMNQTHPEPMTFLKSLAFFGIPLLLFLGAIYLVIPALEIAKVPIFFNFLISLGTPLGLLLLAALAAYQRDGETWTWEAFRYRFRLEPIRGATWWWTLGLVVFMFLASGFLSFSSDWIEKIAPIPGTLARMFEINLSEFMGMPLAGAWWIIPGYLAYVALNVFGEELWWRGYIFPRQELCLGKWTWLVHGLLWNLFHLFFYWEILKLLQGYLALSYVAQRSKNTWPGIIAHMANSIPGLILIIIGVLH